MAAARPPVAAAPAAAMPRTKSSTHTRTFVSFEDMGQYLEGCPRGWDFLSAGSRGRLGAVQILTACTVHLAEGSAFLHPVEMSENFARMHKTM